MSALVAADSPELRDARAIAVAVRERGGRVLVVGGWVRDLLMARPSKDVDLEIYGIEPPALRELLSSFGPVNTVGESFTVYKVAGLDVSLPRRESKIGRGHRGFDVTGDPHLSVREAARRRDFTVNAIGWDPLTGEIVDPFGGREDLDRRVLRVVDPRTFPDDSLRVLRAVQLVARLDLELEPASAEICRGVPLDDLPAERLWGEMEKLLLQASRPSVGLELARDLGVNARLFPEMTALEGCPQEPEWHPEGDVWVHTLLVVDRMRERIDDLPRPKQVTLMLGAVTHDFGKPGTTEVVEGRIRSFDHEEQGVAPALAFLDRLNIHTLDGYEVRRQVVGLVANHLKPGMWHKAPSVGDGAFRRLAQKVDLELLARLAEADCLGRSGPFDCTAMAWFLERARALGVEHQPPPPLLLGRHVLALGVRPGPRVGEVLRAVYDQQLEGAVTTLEDAIASAQRIVGGGRLEA